MSVLVKPTQLKRIAGLIRLFVKHGRPAWLVASDLEDILDPDQPHATGSSPEELAQDLERLGPTYIKLGQLLSTRPDLLPPPYIEALARLQDDVKRIPYEDVEQVVEESLGVKISKAFESFERAPIAAASLAQVHRARLRSGAAVAVKVQRPGVPETVRADLETLRAFAEFLEGRTEVGKTIGAEEMFDEFRQALLAELDFRQEARNLTELRENLASFELLTAPAVIPDYSAERVLTMELIHGRNVVSLSPLARAEHDGRPLLDQLFKSYLKQALVDGFVHADPHPGNVLLTDDGRLALIDVGMVLRIPDYMREQLLRLLLAVTDGRGKEAAQVVESLAQPADGFERGTFVHDVAALVVREKSKMSGEAQVGRIVIDIARLAARHGLRVPRETSLLGKTLLNLDQIAATLDPTYRPDRAVREHADELMSQKTIDSLTSTRILGTALAAKDFAEDLPGRVNRVLDRLGQGELPVRLEFPEDSGPMRGAEKMANRITTGLILSALIVGAAMLMRVETEFQIFGYPGLAMVLFLLASTGGAILLFRVMWSDR